MAKTLFAGCNKVILSPVNEEQQEVLNSLNTNDLTFIVGPAGCGKTYMATLFALSNLMSNRYQKLVLTRPCVEAYGEKIGFLPGDALQKIEPYLIPVKHVLEKYLDTSLINKMIKDKKIDPVPFAFMRGLTFDKSFVLLDEAQNTSEEQMRLFLTRIGKESKVVVTGDVKQSDRGHHNGLSDAISKLKGVDNIGIIELTRKTIVRSKLVADIEARYEDE